MRDADRPVDTNLDSRSETATLRSRPTTFREPLNFQVLENTEAPQVGLEPTTLRLTEGLHLVAGSCGLLLDRSSFCVYRFFGVADFNNVLL
jgi:hypothetical protein